VKSRAEVRKTRARFRGAVLVLAGLSGCPRAQAPAKQDVAEAAKADAPGRSSASPGEACALDDRSGREDPVRVVGLHDAVATKILGGAGGCPKTFGEVAAKLAATDAEACDGGMFSAVQTILVSERAQLRRTAHGQRDGCTGDPIATYRAVTTRTCAGRPAYGLFAALFGLTVDDDALPADTELIGWDEQSGVFNYYALEQGQWSFFGSSIDMLQGPLESGERRCAACHVGGGLVLKEMRSPWVFWEGRDTLPGVTEILDAHAELGSRSQGKVLDLRPAGKELEDAVVAGNEAWTKTRIDHVMQHGTLQQLLAPLFCSMEIELRAVAQSVTPPASSGQDERGTLPVDATALLLDPAWKIEQTIALPLADYHAALTKANQRIERACGAALTDADGKPIRDTAFDLVHPFRSTSDVQVVEALQQRGIVDRGLVEAILSVDLTRPVLSSTRCELLAIVPELPPAERTAAKIRTALRDASKEHAERSEPARALLGALDGSAPPSERAERFVRACAARPPRQLAVDLLEEVSRRRKLARNVPVIELPEMMPVTDLPAPEGGGLDPETCEFRASL
jgi:hypothetical protein